MNSSNLLAPGARVVIRDAEWVIRRVDHSSDGGQQLTCDGLSELVRDKSAIFLTQLDHVRVLDPAQTELVADTSPAYRDSRLYLESLLRQTAWNNDRIHVAHRAAMDLVPYQLDPALQSLRQPRQRILIADAVGLGKTLEAGILVSELIHRGRGKRILVLTLKSMLTQFQKEFWNRFTIPLTRLDSLGLQRVRSRIPTNHNPFYYYDKSIISIDTLKQDSEYRVYLENAYWDIIIIDEAHNVADRGSGALRSRLAKLLATRSDTLIMLSATPHDGRARSFASLMNMLDPTAISDPENYAKDDFTGKGLVIRRFKKDIQTQVANEFKERQVQRMLHPAGLEEESAFEALLNVPFTRGGEHDTDKPASLLRVTLQKALFSSPAACRQSVLARINRLRETQKQRSSAAVETEIAALDSLAAAVGRITPERFGKYQALKRLLGGSDFAWNIKAHDDRLVIFSERIETLNFLCSQLTADLKLKEQQVAILHGGLSDVEQQELVEAFGKTESPLRLLLCSDVAAEGINLHYLSHRLIHFDMPWSLMVFQQRNGRIDRYGQEKTPQIIYLITESQHPVIRGDMRILEVLQQKDDQAYKNIGDPSAFMGVYDIAAEEAITEKAIVERIDSKEFDARLTPKQDEGEDLLALFLGTASAPVAAVPSAPPPVQEPLTLFSQGGDYRFCRQAFDKLRQNGTSLDLVCNDSDEQIRLTAPNDLRDRYKTLPREVVPENWQFVLTTDKEAIKKEVVRCRQDESAWPKVHYLWPQHPVVEWLQDRMLVAFGRHKAPCMELPAGMLQPGETVFVISGQIPNRKSHPLVYEWLAVSYHNGVFRQIEPLGDLISRSGLGCDMPNTGVPTSLAASQDLLADAVKKSREYVIKERDRFAAELEIRLRQQTEELKRLRAKQHFQLELSFAASSQVEAVKTSRKVQKEQEINDIFDRYTRWVEDTLTTEKQPYLHVACVLVAAN